MLAQPTKRSIAKPFLKWAGGKTQLLNELQKYVPTDYNTYIEPFLGGGSLFFNLRPDRAILADSNEELINCYRVVRNDISPLVTLLGTYRNEEAFYYDLRSTDIENLTEVERAARFIYLNKTCFNGLYRVNKKGDFNVPFGRHKNPLICDEDRLHSAHIALQGAKLVCADYKAVLIRYAQENDFVFLDPPYFPVGGYADFQRYTKEFFYDDDHVELRNEVDRIVRFGTKVLVTNSNTDFVKDLYSQYSQVAINTKRLISSKSATRVGQDLIIYSTKGKRKIDPHKELIGNFPTTRYMGSKYKILPFLWESIKHLDFSTALDAFSGSGCVSYMLKQKGVEVYSNDFMTFSSMITKAVVENPSVKINQTDLDALLTVDYRSDQFIAETFGEIYFDADDNQFLDNVRFNIDKLNDDFKKALALAALARACMKRRPRGIFTYVGNRYDDGRRDLQLSLKEHFIESVETFNAAVYNNGRSNRSYNQDVFDLNVHADLVYFDPPYLTSKSDNDYIRRYHFVEGLVKRWQGLTIDHNTKTKKFKRYASPFDSKNTVYGALDRLFAKFHRSIIVVSYSSNSIPSKTEMMELLKKYKADVELKEIDYQYSFGNQNHRIDDNANRVKEYLFIAS